MRRWNSFSPASGAEGSAAALLLALRCASSCFSTSASRARAVVALRASLSALVMSAGQHAAQFSQPLKCVSSLSQVRQLTKHSVCLR